MNTRKAMCFLLCFGLAWPPRPRKRRSRIGHSSQGCAALLHVRLVPANMHHILAVDGHVLLRTPGDLMIIDEAVEMLDPDT